LGLDGDVPDHSTFSRTRHGRFRDADLLRELFVRPGDTQGAQVGLAKAFLMTGKPQLGLSPLSKALEASPQDPKLLLLLGVLKDLEGQHWEAQAYYRDGLARAPGDRGLCGGSGFLDSRIS